MKAVSKLKANTFRFEFSCLLRYVLQLTKFCSVLQKIQKYNKLSFRFVSFPVQSGISVRLNVCITQSARPPSAAAQCSTSLPRTPLGLRPLLTQSLGHSSRGRTAKRLNYNASLQYLIKSLRRD